MSLRMLASRPLCSGQLYAASSSPLQTAARRTLFTKPASRPSAFQRFTKSHSQSRPITALTDSQVIQRPNDAERWKRIAATTAVVVGGAAALSLFNNRETREGGLSPFEASFLNKTFTYVGGGLGITAASAYALHRSGASYRIMRANPWLVMGVSLVASIGSMTMAMSTNPDNTGAKHFWWTAFNIAQSATLSPLL
jgi:hypothetical protein